MSSNSPVLLLAPSAVPTAPIMAPLLVAKAADLRARGLMPSQEKPSETPVAAVGKPQVVMASISAPTADAVVPTVPTASAAAVVETKPASSSDAPVSIVVPPVAQVADAAPVVAVHVVPTPTPTTPAPSTPTPVITPVACAAPSPGPVATAASPVRPSVTPLTRSAVPTTSLVTPTTSTMTKRAAAVAAAAASAAAGPPSALTVTTTASPVSSPKSSPSSPSSPKAPKSSTGRWTEAEHKLFLKGLEQFPYRAWKKIATLIKTRTVVQIRTHAQKYYQKLEKEEQRMREREAQLAAQQQGSAAASSSAAVSALSSAVSTPRSTVPSAPTTPSAAATASLRDLSLTASLVTTPSAAASAAAVASHFASVEHSALGAAGKRKAPLRKRKSSTDDGSELPSSLPKRMMKEKKFVREKTMSPKQKTAVSNSRIFGFGDGDASSGDDCSKGSGVRGLSGLKTHPLDFDDDDDVTTGASAMILDFAEEKPMVEYPFSLDTALERGLAAIDHDELLQLSDDDEGMEWFASATAGEDDLLDGADAASADSADAALNLDGNAFAPLYSEDALHFVDPSPAASECSTPSPILSSSADCSDFGLSSDEVEDDEDFVLDPEKFLSSYFNPDEEKDSGAAAL